MDELLEEGPLDVLVVGGGHFGSRAVEVLLARKRPWRLGVVDLKAEPVARLGGRGVKVLVGDALQVLDRLMEAGPPRWIVPAVPFHLGHAWVLRRLSRHGMAHKIPVPQPLQVPNPLQGQHLDLYASYATFRCPEHCTEPKGTCTVTGLPRPAPLYAVLSSLQVPGYMVAGLRSRQLGPGVGGVLAQDLLCLLEKVREKPGRWILYTACRCHGVLSGLEVKAQPALFTRTG